MNAIKLALGTLAGWLTYAGSSFALEECPPNCPPGTNLPIEDGGLLLVAAIGLAAAIKIARWKQKR